MHRDILNGLENELIKLQETNDQIISSLDAKFCDRLAIKYDNFATFQKQVEALTTELQK